MRLSRITAIAIVVLLVGLFVTGPDGLTARIGTNPNTLPRQLAGPALTTAAATDDAAGPSALIANYPDRPVVGDMLGTQSVVVGPGNSYRTVPGPSLLDPDGTHLMLPGTDGSLTLLNLKDATEHRYRVGGSGFTRAIAFSPDQNTVAYGTSPDRDSEFVREVRLLDLRTGTTQSLGLPGRMAAFSPDGTKIALAGDYGVVIVDRATGNRTPAPERGRLAGDDAWSPDGRLLAYQQAGEMDITLVPVDGSATTTVTAGTFLGWRDATTMLVFDYGGRLRTAGLDGTTQQVMAMPERTGISDAAGALIPLLVFVDDAGAPDHGPLLTRFRWPLLAMTILTIALALLYARRRMGHSIPRFPGVQWAETRTARRGHPNSPRR